MTQQHDSKGELRSVFTMRELEKAQNSIQTGTIWIAFLVHLCIAWTNTSVALKNHPDMEIVRSK